MIKANEKEISITKADRQPIGKFAREDHFSSHSISLNQGDLIYLFTDGYPDQFGGSEGKKFTYKRFRNLLIESSGLAMEHQKEVLSSRLSEWMSTGKETQIDDICVIGIKV